MCGPTPFHVREIQFIHVVVLLSVVQLQFETLPKASRAEMAGEGFGIGVQEHVSVQTVLP